MPKKRKTDNFEKEIVNILKSNVQPSVQPHDSDEMFLLSQLPVIKALSIPQKMDFQIKFIQLLQSYIQPSISQSQFSNPPSVCSNPSTTPTFSQFPQEVEVENTDDDSVLTLFDL